jgi:hypothetical protein
MTTILDSGKFPTCSTCIYSSVKKSISYCIRKAPNPIADNRWRAFWPIVSSDDSCGEGAWLVPVFSKSASYSEVIIRLKQEEKK